MKSKFWKLFILILFVSSLLLAAWFMYHRYTLTSPYYKEEIKEEDSGSNESDINPK